MFDFTPQCHMLALRHGLLIFSSGKSFQPGQSCKIKLELPPQSGKHVPLPVQVLEDLGQHQGGHCYQALVLIDLQGYEYLPPHSLAGHSVHLRVRSPELPNFQAMALEFTARSALLELSSAIEPGRQCSLSFDLEGYSAASVFHCQASSVFCLPSGSKHLCQFRFQPRDASQMDELRQVDEFLAQRANSSLESLLESAKIVPHGALLPASHNPATSAPAPASLAPTSEQIALPVNATLLGYYRSLENQSAILRLAEPAQNQIQELEFPQCQFLWDEETARCPEISYMRPWLTSPRLQQMQTRLGPSQWRHYQFFSLDGTLLLELVSRPCRSGQPSTNAP